MAAASSSQYLPLPLSTLLHTSHPLISPIVARITYLEAKVLLSPPASLLRRVGFSSSSILVLALAAAGAAANRWKAQWRVMLSFLGVAEAVGRSWRVLDALDHEPGPAREHDGDEEEMERAWKSEVKHLLCFWAVFAGLSLGESLRPTTLPTRSIVTSSVRAAARLRQLSFRTYRSLYPYLTKLRLPPSLLPPLTTPPRKHPQPLPFPMPPLIAIPSRYVSEPTYRVLKLLFLWLLLRRDFGAKVVWDYIIGPVYSVRRQRRLTKGEGKTRVVLIRDSTLIEEEDDPDDPFTTSQRSPYSLTSSSPTQPRSSLDESFPTPHHVPYRLVSSSHPIRSASYNRLVEGEDERVGSPSPIARSVTGVGYASSLESGLRKWGVESTGSVIAVGGEDSLRWDD
ncbi:hypothetical protein MNV49_001287 [Pseudohyphozyma bogoriensis]|nr:hypothetical protein MNV49_001287 [Pseudohyphozyma bogoriensis]